MKKIVLWVVMCGLSSSLGLPRQIWAEGEGVPTNQNSPAVIPAASGNDIPGQDKMTRQMMAPVALAMNGAFGNNSRSANVPGPPPERPSLGTNRPYAIESMMDDKTVRKIQKTVQDSEGVLAAERADLKKARAKIEKRIKEIEDSRPSTEAEISEREWLRKVLGFVIEYREDHNTALGKIAGAKTVGEARDAIKKYNDMVTGRLVGVMKQQAQRVSVLAKNLPILERLARQGAVSPDEMDQARKDLKEAQETLKQMRENIKTHSKVVKTEGFGGIGYVGGDKHELLRVKVPPELLDDRR